MIERVIFAVKRLTTPIKLIGLAFLATHLLTSTLKFNPVWILVYLVIAFFIAGVASAGEMLLKRLWRSRDKTAPSFSPEEYRFVEQMVTTRERISKNPWRLLLISGEDGFFFLPLLYIHVSLLSAVTAAALFTVMHYKDKPNGALIGTFLVATLNCLVVLPHGILPMVIGHLLIDGVAFGMAPTMNKWLRQDRMQKQNMEEGCPTTASTRI